MEEKDMQLEPDEDVEGHTNFGRHHEPNEDVQAGREDEDEDVEGHVDLGENLGENLGRQDEGEGDDVEAHAVDLGENLGENLGRQDEGDDVEGHVNIN